MSCKRAKEHDMNVKLPHPTPPRHHTQAARRGSSKRMGPKFIADVQRLGPNMQIR